MALLNVSAPSADAKLGHDQASKRRVLLVESPGRLRDALMKALQGEGFELRTTSTAKGALHQVQSWQPDILLIDLAVDNLNGLTICQRISALVSTPIVVLAAVDAEAQVLEALGSGAVDYATRPLDGRALITRIRTTLARPARHCKAEAVTDQIVEAGPVTIERSRRRVSVRGEYVHFAKMEYEVLLALALRPGEICKREELLDEIWAGRPVEDPRTLDVHVRRIREKLELDPRHPEHLVTVRGVGYYLKALGS